MTSPVERWREMFKDDGLSIKGSEARLRASYSVAHFLASDDAVERIARKLFGHNHPGSNPEADWEGDPAWTSYRDESYAVIDLLASIALSEVSGHA